MYSETAGKFETDIRGRIEYFCSEFGISVGEVIGVLEILKIELVLGALDDEDEDESEAWKKGEGDLDNNGVR